MTTRFLLLFCALSFYSVSVLADTLPVIPPIDTKQSIPTLTFYGNRGLTQTVSAEPLGYGRMNIMGSGTWYQQYNEDTLMPKKNTHVITGIGAFSCGINNHFDVFASGVLYGTLLGSRFGSVGIGSITAGVLGSLPIPEDVPIRLGAQGYIVGGIASDQIDTNYTDGYDYFDTRTYFDFGVRVLESLVFGDINRAVKLHLNEGYVTSLQNGKGNLLLLAAGIQGDITSFFSMGLELNSRNSLNDVNIVTNPFWLTPSFILRTPAVVAFTLGADISLSQERGIIEPQATHALEPYRVFGNLILSFDLMQAKRRADANKDRKAALEKAELEKKNAKLTKNQDSLAQRAREDSLASAHKADSLARVAESLAQKAQADSIALADARKNLEIERSRRSDAEKQLLSTGMLILDAVYFETGKADISMNSKPYLTIIAKMLAKYPKLKLEVGGHTDNVGKMEMNMRLSQIRAESVRMYMGSVTSGLMERLTAMGYGPSVPKMDNNTAEGRKVNRRVELKVLNPEVLKEYNP
jgi:outer membrane protein OmpA-like peptidoglycan-associated protein